MVGVSKRGAGSGLGLRFLWIHLFGWLKSNIQTILVLPDSGRLRLPLNIWVSAGGGSGAVASSSLVDIVTECGLSPSVALTSENQVSMGFHVDINKVPS